MVPTLGTSARKRAFEAAIREVCEDHAPSRRDVVVCHWDSCTSSGLFGQYCAVIARQSSAEA
ncbi:hypothetical protein ABZ860_12340 [Microbispora sp. NPDC046973]|uniref:hypothetical protein n=1 Tax=Microbispora sp. NPDC046973 TaxID=3155022 RepID=UPI0033CBAA47